MRLCGNEWHAGNATSREHGISSTGIELDSKNPGVGSASECYIADNNSTANAGVKEPQAERQLGRAAAPSPFPPPLFSTHYAPAVPLPKSTSS